MSYTTNASVLNISRYPYSRTDSNSYIDLSKFNNYRFPTTNLTKNGVTNPRSKQTTAKKSRIPDSIRATDKLSNNTDCIHNKEHIDYDSHIPSDFCDKLIKKKEFINSVLYNEETSPQNLLKTQPKRADIYKHASCVDILDPNPVSLTNNDDDGDNDSIEKYGIINGMSDDPEFNEENKNNSDNKIEDTIHNRSGSNDSQSSEVLKTNNSYSTETFLSSPKCDTNEKKPPKLYFTGLENITDSDRNGYRDDLSEKFDDKNNYYRIKIGDHIAYKYEILSILGEGSFGTVVKAHDHHKGNNVAIKIIRSDPKSSKQSKEENKILGLLNCTENKSFIIERLETFEFRNHCCMVFELLDINLFQLLERRKYRGIPQRRASLIANMILKCLSAIKDKGIIHCDMKPENILLCPDDPDSVKVIDFGSSCFVDHQMYSYIQSRFYRAPEIILGYLPYNCAIDMWSLGCIIAELITGTPLFPGQTEGEMMIMIMELLGLPSYSMVKHSERGCKYFTDDGQPRYMVRQQRQLSTLTAYSSAALHQTTPNYALDASSIYGKSPGTLDLVTALTSPSTSSVMQPPPTNRRIGGSPPWSEAQREPLDPDMVDFIESCLHWDPEKRIQPNQALRHEWIVKHRVKATNGTKNGVNTSNDYKNGTTNDHNGSPRSPIVQAKSKSQPPTVVLTSSPSTESPNNGNHVDSYPTSLREEMKLIKIRPHKQSDRVNKSTHRMTYHEVQPRSMSPQRITWRRSMLPSTSNLHQDNLGRVVSTHKTMTTAKNSNQLYNHQSPYQHIASAVSGNSRPEPISYRPRIGTIGKAHTTANNTNNRLNLPTTTTTANFHRQSSYNSSSSSPILKPSSYQVTSRLIHAPTTIGALHPPQYSSYHYNNSPHHAPTSYSRASASPSYYPPGSHRRSNVIQSTGTLGHAASSNIALINRAYRRDNSAAHLSQNYNYKPAYLSGTSWNYSRH